MTSIIWLLGAYPAKKKDHQKIHAGVEGSLHYLHSGYNICIFPEGKRSLREEYRAFSGVSRILSEIDSYEMILFILHGSQDHGGDESFLLTARRAPETLDHHDPHAIMDYIYSM